MPEARSPVVCRGVRGAITARDNSREAILEATRELLEEMVNANGLQPDDLASAIFTTSPDLNAAYPAEAARGLGWSHVPLLCTHEMAVPGGLMRCVRVLLHWNTGMRPDEVRHIYLREAQKLRPDLAAQRASSSTQTGGEA